MRESWQQPAEDLFTATAIHGVGGAVIDYEDAGAFAVSSTGEKVLALHVEHGAELTVCRICDYHWLSLAPRNSVEGSVECPNCGACAGDKWDGMAAKPSANPEELPGIIEIIFGPPSTMNTT